MKKNLLFLIVFLFAAFTLNAQTYSYSDCWGNTGFNLASSNTDRAEVVFSVPSFSLEDVNINGEMMKNVVMPGSFLFNDAGMPNLPGKGKYIAIPQGATPKLRIVSQQTETIHNVNIAPAPVIPLDNDPNPMIFNKNMAVYSSNALYPANPVQISGVEKIRGVDVVMLGFSPFQYNPVTKDLIVYRDLRIQLTFEGGNGQFGDPAFRNRWWEPILQDNILNFGSLPAVDFDKRFQGYSKASRNDECEYIILIPTGPEFAQWADSIKNFRNQQGILTKVFTTADAGGNTVAAIETWINNAYNNWTIKPVACLILADYGTDDTKNIISHLYPHPDAFPDFASDNKYADVDNDEMPDIVFSRITANNATQLQVMVSKAINYERTPVTDPLFYDLPITALGWQTERWFQLCSEIVGGYFRTVHDKHPRRINAIYQGTPGSVWSTATNTSTIVNYFGPNGLGYIPQQPSEMPCCWTGGTASKINQAIDSGAFMLQHRDHGNYTAWGEPAYNTGNIGQLNNIDKLTFVFSINCETGAYHRSSECFGEKFHRHTKNGQNAGALGLVCPSETSYSFVNDTYVWGMYDNMWPDFMPAQGTTPPSRGAFPAFGHAAGKYFLKQSNWPSTPSVKVVTYRLFHMFGDAFTRLYWEVPVDLTVSHDTVINYGTLNFNITATDSSLISLTVDNEIIATAEGDGAIPVVVPIPLLPVGTQVLVTVTKENCFRYSDLVEVTSDQLTANFTASATGLCKESSVDFTDLSSGNPTSWAWTFEGGTPATSTDQHPQGIVYSGTGDFAVTLLVQEGTDTDTVTKNAYIHVFNIPTASFSAANLCENAPVEFTDLSNPNGGTITAWAWDFGDPASGTNNTSALQNPTHSYTTVGTYTVSLTATNNDVCTNLYTQDITVTGIPGVAAQPTGLGQLCQGAGATEYATTGAADAITYTWEVTPSTAGTITGDAFTASLLLDPAFSGTVGVMVKGINDCGEGAFSIELPVTVVALLASPATPEGPDTVDLKTVTSSDYTTAGITGAESYAWFLVPTEAGTIAGTTTTGTVTWESNYRGTALVTVKGIQAECEGTLSESMAVVVRSTVGIGENEGIGCSVYPNPTTGKLTLTLNTNGSRVVNLTVYNILGNVVFAEKDVPVYNKINHVIDLSSLPKGIYHLKVEGDGKTVVKKVVIDK
jgi:PKD repeat protein